jgi:hypothetical protein
MTEALYATIIIAFTSLSVLTLFTHMVRGGEIKEEIDDQQERLDTVSDRIAELRTELQKLKFDTDLHDEERIALEAQGQCMLDLEQGYLRQREAEEEGR